MENFNTFEPLLESSKRFGQHLYILAKKGEERILANSVMRWSGDPQKTMGSVLLYDKSTMSLDWKCIYKNTKGYFIKKGRTIYIDKFK